MQSNRVTMESTATTPIIDLDGDNDQLLLSSIKSLGYFFIPRSSSFGQLPESHALRVLVEELFGQSEENKLALGSDYIRSVYLKEPPLQKEFISLSRTSKMLQTPKSSSIKSLFHLCQRISVHLGDLLQLTSDAASKTPDTMLFNHYFQNNEPQTINPRESSSLQFHLYSTHPLEHLDSSGHQWKPVDQLSYSGEYILVTLPNFIARYSPDSSANFTIDYVCYQLSEPIVERTYWLSLRQNKFLRYVTFFYLYVMQGVPAGFSSTALANYLTGEQHERH